MKIHPYNREEDFTRVSNFLYDIYKPGDILRNWLQPRWEYMHYHPFIWKLDLTRIGIAEENGQILGVVHFESNHAEVRMEIRPGFEYIKVNLLDYAEANGFQGMSRSRKKLFRAVYIPEFDTEFEKIVSARGHQKWAEFGEPHSITHLDQPIPSSALPNGFKLQSLADENDLHKINKVLWRGFNHPGEPPVEEIEGRRLVQQSPNFRHDLTIVAVAPDGDYASYCGMYYVPQNQVAYLEPLATDPKYRRRGLARAAILEGLRRVQALGAEVCWVGSGLPVYTATGFEIKFTIYPWAKLLE